MQLLIFVDRFLSPIGGAENQARLLTHYLALRGHRVIVVTRETAAEASALAPGSIECVGCGNADGMETSLQFFLRSVRAAIRRRDTYDLLFAFQLTSSALAAVTVGRMAGKPVVIRLAGGGAAGDIATSQRSWLGHLKLSLVKRSAQRYIGISRDMVQELVDAGFPPSRIVEVPNGVDVDIFSPASSREKEAIRKKLGLPPGLLVIFAGRFSPEKGLSVLLEAWERLITKGKVSATLLLVGRGPVGRVFRRYASETTVEDTILIRKGEDGIAPFLQAADLFLLPSLSEGMSNALLEAMAAGLPVVATAVGGTPQVVHSDREGELVPPDDPGALADAMERMLGDEELRKRIGRSARRRAEQEFGIDRIGPRYERLFNELLVGS